MAHHAKATPYAALTHRQDTAANRRKLQVPDTAHHAIGEQRVPRIRTPHASAEQTPIRTLHTNAAHGTYPNPARECGAHQRATGVVVSDGPRALPNPARQAGAPRSWLRRRRLTCGVPLDVRPSMPS